MAPGTIDVVSRPPHRPRRIAAPALLICLTLGVLATGVLAVGCGDDNEIPSKDDFVAQMRKVLETPPPDAEVDCLYAGIAADPPFAQDMMKTDPTAESRARMRIIAASCVLDPNGRGVAPTTTSTTSKPTDS